MRGSQQQRAQVIELGASLQSASGKGMMHSLNTNQTHTHTHTHLDGRQAGSKGGAEHDARPLLNGDTIVGGCLRLPNVCAGHQGQGLTVGLVDVELTWLGWRVRTARSLELARACLFVLVHFYQPRLTAAASRQAHTHARAPVVALCVGLPSTALDRASSGEFFTGLYVAHTCGWQR
jgi:hypothetical protein